MFEDFAKSWMFLGKRGASQHHKENVSWGNRHFKGAFQPVTKTNQISLTTSKRAVPVQLKDV